MTGRAHAHRDPADALEGGAVQATVAVTVTVKGAQKSSCVAEVLLRYYPG